MDTVTISSKYQIVIPRAIREKWNIKPGQKVELIVHSGILQILPVPDTRGAPNSLKDTSSDIEREEEDQV